MRNKLLFCVVGLVFIGCVVFFVNSSAIAGALDLPRTGQTTCYDAGVIIPCEGTGEDGEVQAGVAWPTPRFVDNRDGTVTDKLTGLMWLKDAGCFGEMAWQQALDTVADFNTNPGAYACDRYTASYDDWVLPNVNELESLFNAGASNTVTWLNGQGFVNVWYNDYWSSTTIAYSNRTYFAWLVEMGYGNVEYDYKSYDYDVWPVRAGQ